MNSQGAKYRHIDITRVDYLAPALRYVVSGDLRQSGGFEEDNHDYDSEVQRRAGAQGIPIARWAILNGKSGPNGPGVLFDSEMPMFCAYTQTEDQANAIAEIAEKVAESWHNR
jgi:hypothetical protein